MGSTQGKHLLTLPGSDFSLLDYITIFWPYMSKVVESVDQVDVEVLPGMEFLWNHQSVYNADDLDTSAYSTVLTSLHVPHMQTCRFKTLLAKDNKYTDLSQSVEDKHYKVCIFPSKEIDRLTWCRILSKIPHTDKVVLVDESCYSADGAGWDLPAIDKRGIPLDKTLDVIRKSEIVIGPPSGIVALAAYAGVFFLTYGSNNTNPWKTETSYNPFSTYGICFKDRPPSNQFAGAASDFMKSVAAIKRSQREDMPGEQKLED
jgi:hypothetical protein